MPKALIRMAAPEDAHALRQIYAPFVTDTNTSLETEVPTLEECTRRIAETLENYPFLLCEEGGAILGYCNAGQHSRRGGYRFDVDVSVYVAPQHHRRRIGSALYSALFAIIREQGYYNAYAAIVADNAASIALHRANGFSEVGVFKNIAYKRGRWEDLIWMEKNLREYDTPAPTKSIGETDPRLIQKILEDCARIIGG